jgi:hypothetical protein
MENKLIGFIGWVVPETEAGILIVSTAMALVYALFSDLLWIGGRLRSKEVDQYPLLLRFRMVLGIVCTLLVFLTFLFPEDPVLWPLLIILTTFLFSMMIVLFFSIRISDSGFFTPYYYGRISFLAIQMFLWLLFLFGRPFQKGQSMFFHVYMIGLLAWTTLTAVDHPAK